jgi:hypothetical protein
MVMTIKPRGRDRFNDLATLTISFSKGAIDTPNRFVTRHDMNAKDKIGADIPLTRASKTFMMEQQINDTVMKNILTKNGYAQEMFHKVANWIHRVNTNSLTLLYPSITDKALSMLDSNAKINNFVRFYTEIAWALNVEAILVPAFGNFGEALNIANKRNVQLIPILDLAEKDMDLLRKQFNRARVSGGNDTPIIAFKFATYLSANKGYDMVMEELDKLHETGQATMIVDAPRFLKKLDARSISAPHYSPFFMADMVVESFAPKWVVKKKDDDKTKARRKSVRLFCKNDLAIPEANPSNAFKAKFELDSEKHLFSDDPQVADLLDRLVNNNTEEKDWYQRRAYSLSRVHESLRTSHEFDTLRKRIEGNEAKNYLEEKADMHTVISNHLSQVRKPE